MARNLSEEPTLVPDTYGPAAISMRDAEKGGASAAADPELAGKIARARTQWLKVMGLNFLGFWFVAAWIFGTTYVHQNRQCSRAAAR